MNFKFQIQDKTLTYKKSYKHEELFCTFKFLTPEWKHLEKYAIFWNKKGKSFIRYLGKGMVGRCPIPKEVFNELYFYAQVYANDDIKTQKKKVFLQENIPFDNTCGKKELDKFFNTIEEDSIDDIFYDDNKLLIYSNNKLIKTIDIVDEQLLVKVIEGTAPNFIVDTIFSEESEHPVANKTLYRALKQKVNKESLAKVSFTGSYNDLKDIPIEFPSEAHTHESEDITNWEDAIGEDLDDFVNNLIENLEGE